MTGMPRLFPGTVLEKAGALTVSANSVARKRETAPSNHSEESSPPLGAGSGFFKLKK